MTGHALPFPLLVAANLADTHHAGQTDKLGNPYIDHPMTVASYLATEDEQVVGFLHDIIEDTSMTAEELRFVFPAHIVDAVVALTHQPNEPRDQYYARVVAAGELAQRVKRADLRHNTDPARVDELDDATRTRLAAKYDKAAAALGTTLAAIHEEFPGPVVEFRRGADGAIAYRSAFAAGKA